MFNVRLDGEISIHLAVAGDVVDGDLFCAFPFPMRWMRLSLN